MEKILLVSDKEHWIRPFEALLEEQFEAEIRIARSSAEGRELLNNGSFSLVLILAPMENDNGIYLARKALESTAGVILACAPSSVPQYDEKLSGDGIFLYNTGMGRRFFIEAVRLMFALHRRLEGFRRPEAERYQDKLKEIRAVDRAKCLLIQYQQMTEKEAHHMIEKRAMDRRCTKREIAEEILKIYDLE